MRPKNNYCVSSNKGHQHVWRRQGPRIEWCTGCGSVRVEEPNGRLRVKEPKLISERGAFFEDNKGGDILEIHDYQDGTYTFQSGRCCVMDFCLTGTITEITTKLSEASIALSDKNRKNNTEL